MVSKQEMQVISEIYNEVEGNNTVCTGNVVSYFKFKYPCKGVPVENGVKIDEDGDLLVTRKKVDQERIIKIEHKASTTLKLVGLQVWRGALLLADFIIYNRNSFSNKNVLELGSGVGLTSIVAGLYAKEVIATDIDEGGILELVGKNIANNKELIQSECSVFPLDFCNQNWSTNLNEKINCVDIVIAADVIYDNDLTEAFVHTLTKVLDSPNKKKAYVALEKRFVFTLADLDTVAPCYEYFLEYLKKYWNRPPMSHWTFKSLPIDFDQYFEYERLKHLVLWEITT